MFPQFIDSNGRRLFSVYHEPEVMDHGDIGVVFCYPYGQEYIRCHKLYVNMANKLASRGFHALRFDYYGTGDSEGDFSSVTMEECLDDLKLVIRQFKESCALSRVVLFGVRVGGTIAILHSQNANVDALVLWNPVLDGCSYLKNIDVSYRRWLNGSFTKEKGRNKDFMENFGFQFSRQLLAEIRKVRIRKDGLMRTIPTLVFGEEDVDVDCASGSLYAISVNKEYWIKRDNENDKAMVPIFETNKTLEWLDSLTWK
jgi:pimeloyl-ACP methyl ester carboxylesterase